MNINLSSRCRYRDFRSANCKIGDYLIENFYSEPRIYQVVHKYDNTRFQLNVIATADYNGNVFLNEDLKSILYDPTIDYTSLKTLPKQHVHKLNKLIIFA